MVIMSSDIDFYWDLRNYLDYSHKEASNTLGFSSQKVTFELKKKKEKIEARKQLNFKFK